MTTPNNPYRRAFSRPRAPPGSGGAGGHSAAPMGKAAQFRVILSVLLASLFAFAGRLNTDEPANL